MSAPRSSLVFDHADCAVGVERRLGYEDTRLGLCKSGPESGVDAAPMAGLAFHDNALNVLERRPSKDFQSHCGARDGCERSVVHGLGADWRLRKWRHMGARFATCPICAQPPLGGAASALSHAIGLA